MKMVLSTEDGKKAQLLMLKILKEVHRVCVENNIKYFLHFGTLIGAVRHNGFIPWDDDLDIGMLYSEFEKFCEIAREKLGDDFVLQTNRNDSGFPYYFARVILKDTVFAELNAVKSKRKYNGVWVDVYPLEKVPENSELQQKFFDKCRMLDYFVRCKHKVISQDKNDKNSFVKKLIVLLVPKFILTTCRNRLFKKYRNLKNDFLISGLWNRSVQLPLSESCYTDLMLHKFENTEVYIPRNYDIVLKRFFGDYMKLPPESERNAHHGIISFDFGKYSNIDLTTC